jgi:hypothetical protein
MYQFYYPGGPHHIPQMSDFSQALLCDDEGKKKGRGSRTRPGMMGYSYSTAQPGIRHRRFSR